jgi:hypothetical protein
MVVLVRELANVAVGSTVVAPTNFVRSPGAWRAQRSGIKGEPAGRGTAAELSTPSARACTEQAQKAQGEYSEAHFQSVLGH